MNKKIISLILFILFVISLYVFQNTLVAPTVEKIASSEFFLEKTDDIAHLEGLKNQKTDLALLHCHHYLTENFELDKHSILSDKDYNAWGLGGYTYVIKSHIEVQSAKGLPKRKTFVCNISYKSGDELNYASWEVSGFTYN